jgi:N-acylglucosamine-6-phosphate 2-epimerase
VDAKKSILQKLSKTIIVSVQADSDEPLNSPEILGALALSVLSGGAQCLRMANPENIAYIKKLRPDVPVIGITKPHQIPVNYHELVYITPMFNAVKSLAGVGTDIVAMDATLRARPQGETLANIVAQCRKELPDLLLMADIATVQEGLHAAELGFDLISTTLSGYTQDTLEKAKNGPDFDLLSALVKQISVPIVMEGRVWEPEEVTKAFHLGAYAVVIGSAITRPHHITRRFLQAVPSV